MYQTQTFLTNWANITSLLKNQTERIVLKCFKRNNILDPFLLDHLFVLEVLVRLPYLWVPEYRIIRKKRIELLGDLLDRLLYHCCLDHLSSLTLLSVLHPRLDQKAQLFPSDPGIDRNTKIQDEFMVLLYCPSDLVNQEPQGRPYLERTWIKIIFGAFELTSLRANRTNVSFFANVTFQTLRKENILKS